VPSPEPLANLDGRLLPLAEARVSALDRGFLFGDGVYEVLRVYFGQPWLEDAHFWRLERSLREIRIGGIDLDRLRRRMRETIAAGPFDEAIVYLQITRGSAPRAHVFPAATTPLEFLFVQAFVDPYQDLREQGADVITRPDVRWDRCDIKSLNLLANVLMAQEAKEAGCIEALLYLADGTFTEGTHTSLMGVVQGTLASAPQGPGILPGTTRALIVAEAGRLGIPFKEQALNWQELERLDELFLTGTTSEVLPIARVDGRPIRDGRPGPVTRMLQKAYADAVAAFRRSG
jgi:D-alanine transaminase